MSGRALAVMLAGLFLAGVLCGLGLAGVRGNPVLPAGFTIDHNDGITYVCSTIPVYCTGNQP